MLFSRLLLRRTSSAPQSPPAGLEHIRIVRSPGARRLALRVDPARGDICLVIPKRVSEKKAWDFADINREWITQRLARLQKPLPFADGVRIPVFGISRTIRIVPSGGRTTHITLTDTTLEVHTPRADPATNIKRFLYDALEQMVRPCADTKARSIGKTIHGITLRDTRTRWGSCGPDGKLMLCWRLVFAPPEVLDYVVAHEVAHLKHMNHSPRFWALCEDLSDDMAFARKWLDANGDALLRYGGKI